MKNKEMTSNHKLMVKAAMVILASSACIFLGVHALIFDIDWSFQTELDPSRLVPAALIPTFLLIVGILSVVNFIRGIRKGVQGQPLRG